MRQIIQLHTDDEKIVSAYPLTLAEAVIVDSATTLDQEIESLEDATKCAAAALYKLNNEKLSKSEADAVYAKADDLEEAEYVTSQALNALNAKIEEMSGKTSVFIDAESEGDVDPTENNNALLRTSTDVEAPFVVGSGSTFTHIFNEDGRKSGDNNALAEEINNSYGEELCSEINGASTQPFSLTLSSTVMNFWKINDGNSFVFSDDVSSDILSIKFKVTNFFNVNGQTHEIASNYAPATLGISQVGGNSSYVQLKGYNVGDTIDDIEFTEITIPWSNVEGSQNILNFSITTSDSSKRIGLFEMTISYKSGEHTFKWKKLAEKDVVESQFSDINEEIATIVGTQSIIQENIQELYGLEETSSERITHIEESLGDVPIYIAEEELPEPSYELKDTLWKLGEQLYACKCDGIEKEYWLTAITSSSTEINESNYAKTAEKITNGFADDFVFVDASKSFSDNGSLRLGSSSKVGSLSIAKSESNNYPDITKVTIYGQSWNLAKESSIDVCGTEFVLEPSEEIVELTVSGLEQNTISLESIRTEKEGVNPETGEPTIIYGDYRCRVVEKISVCFGNPHGEWIKIGGDDDKYATKQELYDVEEVVSYSLNDLNTRVEEVSGSVESKADAENVYTKGEISTLLGGKANSSDVYTKSETYSKEEADEIFITSGDVYTKSETDEIFATKQELEDDEFVTSQSLNDLNVRVDSLSGSVESKADIEDVYTKEEADERFITSGDVYTKSEADEKFTTKEYVEEIELVASQALNDLNTRVNAVSGSVESKVDIEDVYTKSETYTQTETDNAISTAVSSAIAGKIEFRVVESLPATGESSVIYLVPKTTAATQNEYDEYAWINSKWELIGKTDIDLSQYALLTNLTDGSVTKVGTTTVGGNGNPIYLNGGVPTELTVVDKATKDAIGNTISEYYTPISSHNTLSGAVDEIKVDVDEMDVVVSKALVNLDDRIKNISASTSEVISSLSSRVDTIDSSITSLVNDISDLRSDFDDLVAEYSGASRTIAQSLVDLNAGLSNKANTSFVGSGTIGSGSATFDTIVEAVNWLIQQQ